MRIDVITILPELIESNFSHSIVKRAQAKGLVSVHFHNLRAYSKTNYHKVDDYPYGGAAGMVLMIEPIDLCIKELKSQRSYDEIIYLTPDGEVLNQSIANAYSIKENIILLCGHYKGIDQRVRDHLITKELSIGNFVLSGGELAASVFCDSIVRLIPGVLGDESSALFDSFQDGLIAPPIYTRPAEYNNWKVPEILTSGNKPEIDKWNQEQSEILTEKKFK